MGDDAGPRAIARTLVPDCRLVVLEDAAHGMFLTHVERVDGELLEFARAAD